MSQSVKADDPEADSDKSAVGSREPIVDPLSKLRIRDWIFVLLCFWTLGYAIQQNMDLPTRDLWYDFDYLPIIAASLIIAVVWPALRWHGHAAHAIAKLQSGAGLEVSGDLLAFLQTYTRRKHYFALAGAVIIAFSAAVWMAYITYAGNLIDIVTQHSVLLAACLAGGAVIGYLMGLIYGDVSLLRALKGNDISFTRIETPDAQEAISEIGWTLKYSLFLGILLSHYFIVWFAIWATGANPRGYFDFYAQFYLLLLIVSFGFFVIAGLLPSWSYTAQITSILGGTELVGARREQTENLTADLEKLRSTLLEIINTKGKGAINSETRNALFGLRSETEAKNLSTTLATLQADKGLGHMAQADRNKVEKIAAEMVELAGMRARLSANPVSFQILPPWVLILLTAWIFIWIPIGSWIVLGGNNTPDPFSSRGGFANNPSQLAQTVK